MTDGKKFRFLFCSGRFAEWDQTKRPLFMADTRLIKVRLRNTGRKHYAIQADAPTNSLAIGRG